MGGIKMKKFAEVIAEELRKANDKYPPFTSPMEGLGVIEEERYEAQEEWEQIQRLYNQFKRQLRADNLYEARLTITTMINYISQMMEELSQLGAMCIKFDESMDKL